MGRDERTDRQCSPAAPAHDGPPNHRMRFYLRCISYFRKDLPQILLSLVLIAVGGLVFEYHRGPAHH